MVLTERALGAVRTLIAQTPEPGEQIGLRIRAEPVGEDRFLLDVKVVEAPAENDFLLEEDDVRVYLEQVAFLHLNDKVLDARTDEQKIVFSVSEEESEQSVPTADERGRERPDG